MLDVDEDKASYAGDDHEESKLVGSIDLSKNDHYSPLSYEHIGSEL